MLAALFELPAAAQSLPGFDRSESFEITAESIEYDQDREIYVAEGHVRLVQGERILEARWATFSNRTRLGVASGDVVYIDGVDRVEARFFEFDVDTLEGVVFDGDFDFTEGGLRIAAKELVRTGEDRYRVFDARFTTCRCPDDGRDPWAIEASRSDIHVGGYGTARNTTFEVLGVPVLWVPWMFFPVKTERQTGLLVPDLEFGGRNGYGFGIPFFWAARENVNVTATSRWTQERGVKQDLEVEAVYGTRSRTQAFGAFAHDDAIEALRDDPSTAPLALFSSSRWTAQLEHDQELPADLRLVVDGKAVSDNQYPLDFHDLESERRSRFLESSAFVGRHFGADGRLGFELASRHADDLMNPDDRDRDRFLLQRWADLEIDWLSGPLPGLSEVAGFHGLSAALVGDYEYFGRPRSAAALYDLAPVNGQFLDTGADGLPNPLEVLPRTDDDFATTGGSEGDGIFQEGEPLADTGHRLTLHPRLSWPRRWLGVLETRPEIGWRETLYWTEARDFERRGRFTARDEWRLRFERDFAVGTRNLHHKLIPRVGWAFLSRAKQSDLPLLAPPTAVPQLRLRQRELDNLVLDSADRVPGSNRLVVGVDNRFYLGDGPDRLLAAELGVGFDYDFERGGTGGLLTDAKIFAPYGTRAELHVFVDPDRGRLDDLNAELSLPLPFDLRLSGRYRYVREAPHFFEDFSRSGRFGNATDYESIEQVGFDVALQLFGGLDVSYGMQLSLETDETLTKSAAITYTSSCKCWAAGIAIDETRNQELRVRFRYTLTGFGDAIGNPFGKSGGWLGAQ